MSTASDDRERVADTLTNLLQQYASRFSSVHQDGDRVSLIYGDELAVQIIVADARPVAPEIAHDVCPFCGSRNLNSDHGNEMFEPRRGCLDCDRWIDSVRVRRKR